MGKIKQGILGPISGKIGNVIGASWRGIHYLRVKPASVKNPRTLPQLIQRSKFSLAIKLARLLLDFIRIGFNAYSLGMSAFNVAVRRFILNAVTGEFPDFYIDYSKVTVSDGNLRGVDNAGIDSCQDGILKVSWSDNSGLGNARPGDQATLLVINPELDDVCYDTMAGTRADCEAVLDLPVLYSGTTVQAYLTFTSGTTQLSSSSKDSVSRSIFLGEILVELF
jgi:hypothetical protein